MKAKFITSLFLAATILGSVLPQVARAALPMLEQPWLGRFAVTIDKGFRLYVSATDKLRKTTFRGKAVGADPVAAVSFEATIERVGDSIFIGGRVTDPGPFQSSAFLACHIMYPAAYFAEMETRAEWDKNQEKEFEKRTKRDVLELKHLDGKRSKLSFFEKIDANSKEVNGGGISSAMVSIAYFPDMSLNVTAEANSALSLWHPAPLTDAFRLIWRPNAAKDPEHKARLAIRVK